MIKLLIASMVSSIAYADMSLQDYIKQPAQPLTATITVNDQKSAVAEIGKTGGTIELKAADGSVFRLVIPAGALEQPTSITMSEITSFTNPALTFDQPAIGVQLSPDGLLFAKPARLKIIPKKAIPAASLLPITAEHSGAEIRLAALAPDAPADSIELSLSHFSPYVLTGSQTAREAILKAFNSIAASRLESWTANELIKIKNGQGNQVDVFQKAFSDYFETVVKVHATSVESCEGGIAAQRTLLGWMRQNELLGGDHTVLATENFKSALVSKTAKLCRDKARQACYEDHRVFDVMRFALGVSRQAMLLGIENDPHSAALMELALKCMHFEFVMDSAFTNNDTGELTVKAHTQIDFSIQHVFTNAISSKGFVQVTEMVFEVDGLNCKQTSLDAPPAESVVEGFGLKDERFDQSLGIFIQGLYPKSVGKFKCTDDSKPPNTFDLSLPFGPGSGDDSFWGGMFLAFHSQPQANEYNSFRGRYEFFKWDVHYGELFATKTYKRNLEMLKEDTVMKIFHRPRL